MSLTLGCPWLRPSVVGVCDHAGQALRVSYGLEGKGLGAKSFLLTVEPYVVIGDMQVSHGCPRAPSFEKQAVLKSTVLKCIANIAAPIATRRWTFSAQSAPSLPSEEILTTLVSEGEDKVGSGKMASRCTTTEFDTL